MIHAVLVINNLGKPRLTKFYEASLRRSVQTQQALISDSFAAVSSRSDGLSTILDNVSAFLSPDVKLVYKHFATLYFLFFIDDLESELATLDLIQVFVETLDACFPNVSELDLAFNFPKAHAVLDEIICGGMVIASEKASILQALQKNGR
eukprot:jgi/Mesvir1/16101/Mv08393-RA.1